MPPIRVAALSGSFRHQSYCTQVLATMRDRYAGPFAIAIHDYRSVPGYCEDDDVPNPAPAVAALRNAVATADAVIVATPEFNHGLPGTIKNALDWMSRPRGGACMAGKPVLTITASPAITGGVRAHAQLNETLLAMAARIIVRPQAVIGVIHQKLSDGALVDEATLAFLDAAMRDLGTTLAPDWSAR